MITYSGRRVFPNTDEGPSIEDIAISLGRMPRFGGGTRRWWPVVLHSLVVMEIVDLNWPEDRPLKLHALLHDAHECVTGDIPRTWKIDSMRRIQKDLDRRIYASLGLLLPSDRDKEKVKIADNMALSAEALLVGPPKCDRECGPAHDLAIGIVQYYLEHFKTPNTTAEPDSEGVQLFLQHYHGLRV